MSYILGFIIGLIGSIFLSIIYKLYSIPKWKEVYFKIIKEVNDGRSDEYITSIITLRYGLTKSQSLMALEKAKEADIEWFETAIWR